MRLPQESKMVIPSYPSITSVPNNSATYVLENAEQYYYIEQEKVYVPTSTPYFYTVSQPEQVVIPYQTITGGLMSVESYLPVQSVQPLMMYPSTETMCYNEFGQPVIIQNEYVIEQQEQHILIPSAITAVPSQTPVIQPPPMPAPAPALAPPPAPAPALEPAPQPQPQPGPSISDRFPILRRALESNYNPYDKREPTPAPTTTEEPAAQEMSEEETNWAFEGIQDLTYLADPSFKNFLFSLPCRIP